MAESLITRRWSIDVRSWVDPKHQRVTPVDEYLSQNQPSKGQLGSSPTLLSLPTELRVNIYQYLSDRGAPYLTGFKNYYDLGFPSVHSTKYAYLYRSPGRATKPNAITREVLELFHICRQIREELIDAFFSDRIFVLEASLYQRDIGGLTVLPPNLQPTAWVKRLLLLTVVELSGRMRGIGDLRPLQRMTNLRELRIVFMAKRRSMSSSASIINVLDNPIKAILECVPQSTEVQFGIERGSEEDLVSRLGPGVRYLLDEHQKETQEAMDMIKYNMELFNERKGQLSGSTVDHSRCMFRKCRESLHCVNSLGKAGASRPRAGKNTAAAD